MHGGKYNMRKNPWLLASRLQQLKKRKNQKLEINKMAYSTDSDFEQLSQKVKDFIWVIKASCKSEACGTTTTLTTITYATGFAIQGRDGFVLMTCAHCLCEHILEPKKHKNNENGCSIKVRRLNDQDFIYEAMVAKFKSTWDLALLTVVNLNDVICGEFVDDGSIMSCQPLVQVGHSTDLVWSVFVGRACFQCVDMDDDDMDDDDMDNDHCIKCCEVYTSNSFYITPNCRKLGDLWNADYFSIMKSDELTFERKMCGEIKVIQCAGLSCRKGCSGGPVFDIHGKIVGMMLGEKEVDGCQIALHVSLLKRFLNDSSTTTKGELKSKATWEGDGTTKGASKRPKKRKGKGKAPM